jgi:hypothetical protein
MALYYFHLRDGKDVLLDPEGCELPDFKAVVDRTMATARSILSADLLDGHLDLDLRIDVVDAKGKTIHSLNFADAVQIRPRAGS